MSVTVLEDSLLNRLALNPTVARAFPFLAPLAAALVPGGCNCGNSNVATVRNAVRAAVAGLSPDRAAAFKAQVGAASLRVYYDTGAGVTSVTI